MLKFKENDIAAHCLTLPTAKAGGSVKLGAAAGIATAK